MKFGKRLHRASLSFTDPAYAAHLLDYKALKKIIKRLASRGPFIAQDASSLIVPVGHSSPSLSSASSSPAAQSRHAQSAAGVPRPGDDLSSELAELSTAGRVLSASAVRETADWSASSHVPSSNSSSASTASNASLSILIPSPQHCGLTDSPTSPLSASPSPASPSHPGPAHPLTELTELEYFQIAHAFVAALEAELHKINTFYDRVVSLMVSDVASLRDEVMGRHEGERDLSSLSDLCENLNQVRKFIVLNYLGVIKIVKKHDKNAPRPVADSMIPLLYAQPFYHSLQVAALYTEIDSLSRHGLKAVSREDYSCPLCDELLECPVVLSCSHRFCWKCLSRAAHFSASEQQACPVCRKPQLLDPSNYLVDDLLLQFIRANFPKKGNSGLRLLSSSQAPSPVEQRHGGTKIDTRSVGVKEITDEPRQGNGRRHSAEPSYSQPSTAASYSSTAGASLSASFSSSSSSSSSSAVPALVADWGDGGGSAYTARRRRSDASLPHDYTGGPHGPHLLSASSYRYHPYNDYSVATIAHTPYSTAAARPLSAHYAPAFIHPSQRQAQLDAERMLHQQQMEHHLQQQQQQHQEHMLQQSLQMHLRQQLQQQHQQHQPHPALEHPLQPPPQHQPQPHHQHQPHHHSQLGSPTLPPSALEMSPPFDSVSPDFPPTPPPSHSDLLLELPSAAVHQSGQLLHSRLTVRPWQRQEGTGDRFLLPWLREDEEDEDVCAEVSVDPVNIGYHVPYQDYAGDDDQLDRQTLSHDNPHRHTTDAGAGAGQHGGEDFDMQFEQTEHAEHLAANTSPLSASSAASSLSSHDSFSSANMPLLSLTSMNHLLLSEDDVDEQMHDMHDGGQLPPLPPIESGENPAQLLPQTPQPASEGFEQPDSQQNHTGAGNTPPPGAPSPDNASIDQHMDSLEANLAAAMSRQQPQLAMQQAATAQTATLPYAQQAIVVGEPQPHSAHSLSSRRRSHPRSESFHSESSSGSHSGHSPALHAAQANLLPDFSASPPSSYHYLQTAVAAREVPPHPPPRSERPPPSLPLSPSLLALVVPSVQSSFNAVPLLGHSSSARFEHPSAISTRQPASSSSSSHISASAPSSPIMSDFGGRPPLSANAGGDALPVGRSSVTSPSGDSVGSSLSSPASRPLPGGRVPAVSVFPGGSGQFVAGYQSGTAPTLPRAASYTAVPSTAAFAHGDDSRMPSESIAASRYGLSVQIPHTSPLQRPNSAGPHGVSSSASVWMPMLMQQQQQQHAGQTGGSAEQKEAADGDVLYSNLSPTSTASSGAGSVSTLLLNSSSDNLSSTGSSPTASSPQSASFFALAQEVGPSTPREAAMLRFNSGRNNPKFICDHAGCNDGFNTRFSLKRHLKTHSGEKPFQCNKCPKTFAEKSTLVRHLRIHTGEKPFRCTWMTCTRSFSDRTNVKRHEAQHEAQKDLPMEEQTAWLSEEAERELLKRREADARRRHQMLATGARLEDVELLEEDERRKESEARRRKLDERARELQEQVRMASEDGHSADAQMAEPAQQDVTASESVVYAPQVKDEPEEVKMDGR